MTEWPESPYSTPSSACGRASSTPPDPWREQDHIDACAAAVREAGGEVEVCDYPGKGHLFGDPSLPSEYDEAASELCWARSLEFCSRL